LQISQEAYLHISLQPLGTNSWTDTYREWIYPIRVYPTRASDLGIKSSFLQNFMHILSRCTLMWTHWSYGLVFNRLKLL